MITATVNECVAEPPAERVPRVYMIGAAKSGTTLLSARLWQHPKVHEARPKEPEYFSFEENYAKGIAWYAGIYQGAQADQLIIDASTGYTRFPDFPDPAARIHAHAPDAKLIYLMRHPVDRAYSHYIHRWSKELHRNEPFRVSFEEHIRTDTMCIDSSNYKLQLQQYLRYFAPESILCLFSHELRCNEAAVLKKTCEFLGLDYDPTYFCDATGRENGSFDFLESRIRRTLTNRVKNLPGARWLLAATPKVLRERAYEMLRHSKMGISAQDDYSPPVMKQETRDELIEYFRESNAWIERFTGVNLDCWNH